MLRLLIDNKEVVLTDDFDIEIEYVNPYFEKNNDASLDVDIPLNCSTNKRIFSNVNRFDRTKSAVKYDAKLYANGRLVFNGTATINKVEEDLVNLQFIAASDENALFNDEKYMDKLDLEYAYLAGNPLLNKNSWVSGWRVTSDNAQDIFGSSDTCDFNIFRNAITNSDGDITSAANSNWLMAVGGEIRIGEPSWFPCNPYLTWVIKAVANKMGYKIGRDDIKNSWMKHIYIVSHVKNLKNLQWSTGISRAYAKMDISLPHWTLSTFFDEIEKFCGVVIRDNGDKTVDIVDINTYYTDDTERIYIEDDQVLDEYSVECGQDVDDKDIMTGNVAYSGDYTDKYVCPDDSITLLSKRLYCDGEAAIKEQFNTMESDDLKRTIFVNSQNNREYCAYKAEEDEKTYSPKEINVFGPLKREDKLDNDVELKIIPSDMLPYSNHIGLEAIVNDGSGFDYKTMISVKESADDDEEGQTEAIQELIENEETIEEEEDEDTSPIEVAINTGDLYRIKCNSEKWDQYDNRFPIPFTDFKQVESLIGTLPEMSLSLHDVCEQSIGHRLAQMKSMRTDTPYYITFISEKKYSPYSIFIIHNQAFVCEYIKTTYSQSNNFENEGKFYRIGI
jgi:hypothetical protein